MSQQILCPKCGAEISAGGVQGLCPKCLMAAGLESGGDPTRRSGSGKEAVTTPHSVGFVSPAPAALAGYFPHLEIVELVGQGGMGAVYKARQPKLDRIVALKIIRPESADSRAFADRFNREARLLARLSHPHIVSVYDFGEVSTSDAATGGRPRPLYFFLMEYVEGANLRELMRAGELTPKQVLAIIPQICEALQFAHDEGIVHRDIKPENILLDKRGRVKIADFGLAKLVDQAPETFALTATHQVMGTPRYMAPEQMDGARAVDHRADIYSLGVVFYEMLTGEVPAGHFEPPSKKVQVDVRLDEVVLRAMAREPERRYQQASEIKTDVERCSSTGAKSPGLRSILHGNAGGNKTLVKGVVLAALFLVAATAAGFIGSWLRYPSSEADRDKPVADVGGDRTELIAATAQYAGRYRSGAGVVLTLTAGDAGLIAKLSPSSELETAESIPDAPKAACIQILEALKRDDATPIGEHMAARIPADWPSRIEQYVWPENLHKFGELQSFQLLGWERRTDAGPDSELVNVWAVLKHARGEALACLSFSAPANKLEYLVLDAEEHVRGAGLKSREFSPLSSRTFSAGNDGATLRFDESGVLLVCRPIQSTFLRAGKEAQAPNRSGDDTGGKGIRLAVNTEATSGDKTASENAKEEKSGATPSGKHNALSFDGVDDFVEIPDLKYDGTHPLTIELRARSASRKDYQQLVLVSNFDYVDKQDYGICLLQRGNVYPTPTYVSWAMAFAGKNKTSQSLIASDKDWQKDRESHIAFVAAGRRFQFYIDGELWRHGELEDAPAASKQPFTIGGHPTLKGYFQGTIAEVRLSKVARYAKNFTPAKRFEPDKDTLALYHCDEANGNTLTDSSGNKHDGKINGATWVRTE